MLVPTKCILVEYKNLVVKMSKDQLARNVIAKFNYEVLCDSDTILGLIYVLPMLEVMQSLSKLVSGRNTVVCNLVNSLLLYIIELFAMYLNTLQRYDQSQFQTFKNLANNVCDILHMVWYLEPQTQIEYATFWFNYHLFMLHKTCHVTRLVSMVSRDDWALAFQFVKDQYTCVVEGLIKESERHFFAHELINATMIIYP
jgi:hypothetical protein